MNGLALTDYKTVSWRFAGKDQITERGKNEVIQYDRNMFLLKHFTFDISDCAREIRKLLDAGKYITIRFGAA